MILHFEQLICSNQAMSSAIICFSGMPSIPWKPNSLIFDPQQTCEIIEQVCAFWTIKIYNTTNRLFITSARFLDYNIAFP